MGNETSGPPSTRDKDATNPNGFLDFQSALRVPPCKWRWLLQLQNNTFKNIQKMPAVHPSRDHTSMTEALSFFFSSDTLIGFLILLIDFTHFMGFGGVQVAVLYGTSGEGPTNLQPGWMAPNSNASEPMLAVLEEGEGNTGT